MLLAGGTDLLPNMKRRQQVPRVVVGLRGVRRTVRTGHLHHRPASARQRDRRHDDADGARAG